MESETSKATNSLNRRLGHLESEVAGISTKVDGLEGSIGRIVTSVDLLSQRLVDGKQTNWSVVISSLGLVVVIGGLCLAPIYARLADDKESQRRQWEAIRKLSPLVSGLEQFKNDVDLKDQLNEAHSISRHEKVLEKLNSLKDRVDKVEIEQTRRTGRVYKHPNGGS